MNKISNISNLKSDVVNNEKKVQSQRSIFDLKNKLKNTDFPPRNNEEKDAKVDIDEKVKAFSKIKKAVDMAPDLDQTNKINGLKNKINAGTYEINYEALADKMLKEEF